MEEKASAWVALLMEKIADHIARREKSQCEDVKHQTGW